jgi:hypothetical protein
MALFAASQRSLKAKRLLSFAKTLQGQKSRPVTMLQARPHAIHFKPILDFGEGQGKIQPALWGFLHRR